MARLRVPATIGALALACWLAVGRRGFANYDALYSLLWGRQIAGGHAPDYGVSLAPTPHPLSNLIGTLLSPLAPTTSEGALVVIGFLALGTVGWLVYELGRTWFSPAVGVLAAAILLTREPVLSYGVRAYVDLPYLALVLCALLVEARTSRRGTPTLALLALAGLIRPEAWLFSAAYLVYLRRPAPALIVLAAAAPVIWLGADLLVTGDPLSSLIGTRDTTVLLGRQTGIGAVAITLPRRIGEVVREPVLLGAVVGLVLTLARPRERASVRLLLAGLGLALAAAIVLAAAGTPVIARYTFLISALTTLLCAAGALGWTTPRTGDPRRRPWILAGAGVLVALAAFVPQQLHRIADVRTTTTRQQALRDQLYALAGSAAVRAEPLPLGVANHRLLPQVALIRGIEPNEVVAAPFTTSRPRSAIWPANHQVARDFILDPRDPSQQVLGAPGGSRIVASNPSWDLRSLR